MLSLHSHTHTPAADLQKRGTLEHVAGNLYRFQIPANGDVGPVGSYWRDTTGELTDSSQSNKSG